VTRPVRQRIRAAAATAAAALAVAPLVLGAAPARAASPDEYWFQTLEVTRAWAITKGAGVTVAVVGAGVPDSHIADLTGRVLPGIDLTGGGGDGRSDPGEDCSAPGGCYSAGLDAALRIAGTGAGAGYRGMAPAARILPVKITARSGAPATPDQVATGVRWAVDHGAQIIQVPPISTGELCPAVEDEAGKYAYQHGVLIVGGVGDTGQASEQPPSACYGSLAVSASSKGFVAAARTDYGPNLAFTAAGVDVPVETVSGHIRTLSSGSGGAAALVAGTFALLRAHFAQAGDRELITRALYNVHNGTGRFGEQIDYKLGYGEILPYHALHDALPTHTVNPIFDDWVKNLGPPAVSGAPTGTPPTSAPSSASDPSSSSGTPSGPAASGGTQSGPVDGGLTVGGSGSSSGTSTGLLVGIGAAVVVIALVVALLVARSRRGTRAVRP
jgi:hypothetical protein